MSIYLLTKKIWRFPSALTIIYGLLPAFNKVLLNTVSLLNIDPEVIVMPLGSKNCSAFVDLEGMRCLF